MPRLCHWSEGCPAAGDWRVGAGRRAARRGRAGGGLLVGLTVLAVRSRSPPGRPPVSPAMASQPPLGLRKRSGSALCRAGWAGVASPAAADRGEALENGFPPHKRPKSSRGTGRNEGPGDPFGDNDDFTADDLEEIDDILASQALSQEVAGPPTLRPGLPKQTWGSSGASSATWQGLPRGCGPAAGRSPKGRCARGHGVGVFFPGSPVFGHR